MGGWWGRGGDDTLQWPQAVPHAAVACQKEKPLDLQRLAKKVKVEAVPPPAED